MFFVYFRFFFVFFFAFGTEITCRFNAAITGLTLPTATKVLSAPPCFLVFFLFTYFFCQLTHRSLSAAVHLGYASLSLRFWYKHLADLIVAELDRLTLQDGHLEENKSNK